MVVLCIKIFLFWLVLNIQGFRTGIIDRNLATFSQKANSLKQSLKNSFKPEKTTLEEQIGSRIYASELEYPGSNAAKLKEIQELWDDYYRCLAMWQQSLGPQRTATPIAVTIIMGNSLKLDCNLCQSPRESLLQATWYFSASANESEAESIDEAENVVVSQQDDTLQIFNTDPQNTGMYFCHNGNNVGNPYFVQILDETDPIIQE